MTHHKFCFARVRYGACNCTELAESREAIAAVQRVRDLTTEFEREGEHLVRYELVARRIFSALDGEQS
jgi:hypothetical protein